MSKLIGIAGLARSGKDTMAEAIVRNGYRRLAFANALKSACAYIAREHKFLWFSDEHKEAYCRALGMSRREALQSVGAALRGALGPDVWANRVLKTWAERGREPAVVSDVRYDNEAKAIRDLGGIIVRVVRPGAGLSGSAALHESELGIDDDLVDIEIINDGSVSELEVEARKIVEYVRRLNDDETFTETYKG